MYFRQIDCRLPNCLEQHKPFIVCNTLPVHNVCWYSQILMSEFDINILLIFTTSEDEFIENRNKVFKNTIFSLSNLHHKLDVLHHRGYVHRIT